MEFLKDYDSEILYHDGKANVVADALSRKSVCMMNCMMLREWGLLDNACSLSVGMQIEQLRVFVVNLSIQPNFISEIKEAQGKDVEIQKLTQDVEKAKQQGFEVGSNGIWRFGKRLCVPDKSEVKDMILNEAHKTRYTDHPGSTKMFHNLRELF